MKWYKRDPDAWLAGVMNLTLEERGAYDTLIEVLYSRDGNLPPDQEEAIMSRACGVRPQMWRRLRSSLIAKGKIHPQTDGKLTANRVRKEVETATKLIEKMRGLRQIQLQNQTLSAGDTARTTTSTSTSTKKESTPIGPKPVQLALVPEAPRASRLDSEFKDFYGLYPRKEAPRAAEKAFIAARKRGQFEDIMAGLKRAIPKWDDPKYIPHPASWLNKDRWLDQPTCEREYSNIV